MPEPENKKDESDICNLNRAAPFDLIEHYKVNMKDKGFFLTAPVMVGYIALFMYKGMGLEWEGNYEYKGRNLVLWISMIITFYWTMYISFNITKTWRGSHHSAYTLRIQLWALGEYGPLMCLPAINFMTQQNYAQMAQFHFLSDRWAAIEAMWNNTLLTILTVGLTWSMNHPKSFAERSAYGVYCCYSMTNGLVLRIALMCTNVVMLDYFVSTALAQPKLLNVGDALAVAVYGFKRFKYILLFVICLDDSSYKHRSVFAYPWIFSLFFNHTLALSQVGAENWVSLGTFIACDWVQFFVRIVLLLRSGMKTCPTLITFLLKKQLENTMSPLPNHVESVGDKTAMRVNQALLALLEGESLSVNFLLLLLFFVYNYNILGYNKPLLIVPMRSVGIIFIFMALDVLQDIIAATSAHRFSNFSYVFGTTYGCWHSKAMIKHWVQFYIYWMAGVCFLGGCLKAKLLNTDVANIPSPVIWDYAMTDYCVIHA
jgi:hypothetical protein